MAENVLTSSPPTREDGGHNLLAWYREVRASGTVWHEPAIGMWHVLDYPNVQRVLSDWNVFSSDLSVILSSQTFREGNYQLMDPPLHNKFRGLVNQAFTPRAVRRLEPRIAELFRERLAEVDGLERFDLVERIAHPVPVSVLAALLGVPDADHGLLRGWADDVFKMNFDDRLDPSKAKSVDEATMPMHDYFLDLVRERRKDPRDDLLSEVIQAQGEGGSMQDEEAVTAAAGLLLAGHLTSTLLLGSAVRCLHEHPEAAAALREDPSEIPGFLEEVMRFYPPFSMVLRFTKTEVELDGQTIPANSVVVPSLLAANRDPDHFSEPDRFDHRRNAPNVAFGYGVHYCIGASLARLEGRISVGMLLERYSQISLDEAAPPEYFAAPGLFGPKRLPVVVS
ncbi:cytochrome P450 [Dactylosporangium sp. CA-152071]|uniref:cytochrome P450 n=1 Tax=Dactylosporangium sp. CA-152071 TaxID=3239933 RepID=UPI003D8BEF48